MWIIAALVAAIIGALIPILNSCDWSPVVRFRYREMGWADAARASQDPPPLPSHLERKLQNEYSATGRVAPRWEGNRTDLTMSRRRFTYYLDGYQAALEYARWQEGITATRRSELDRVRRLDHEIRKAHHELTEEA